MPAVSGNVAVFDDFSGGEYGNLGSEKAAANQFTGTNMLVTADGGLVPRPGLAEITPTGMPTGKIVALTPTTTPLRDVLFIVANKVYTYNKLAPGSGKNEIGTLDVTPTLALYPKRGTSEYYITIPADKCYILDPVTNTIDPLTDSPGGTDVEIYGERLVVAGADQVYQLQFSAAADFDDWPAENFVNVPNKRQITSIREQRNHLTIFKRNGVFILTGAIGTSAMVLRKADDGLGPLHPGQLVPDEQAIHRFIAAFHTNPASFDGAVVRQESYLTSLGPERDGDTPALPVVLGAAESIGDASPSTVLITQGSGVNRMLLNHNGIWTKHTTSVNITGMVRGGETGDFYLTDGGAVGVAGKIYITQFDLDRPGFASDGFAQPGDVSTTPVTASFTLPAIWAADRTDIAIRSIVVDFVKYNTGSASTNNFTVSVQMSGGDRESNPAAVTNTWSEATASATTTGKITRKVLNFKTAKAGRAEISFSAVRGVKIESVKVYFHKLPEQPVK